MSRKGVVLKHPIEGGVDFVLGNFPRHQGALRQVRRKQSLPDTPYRSGVQHRGNPRHDNIDPDTGTVRDFHKRLADESFDFILRNCENLRVNWIVMLNRQHPNCSAHHANLSN
jgi:hypothetical protein